MQIRFTQPCEFNDPFEFRPNIQAAASNEMVRQYVEENFEALVEKELGQYGILLKDLPPDVKELLLALKKDVQTVFRMLEPEALRVVSPAIQKMLNENVGVLCLSEIRDSALMWGHYAESHRGFVIGFDSESPFFHQRKTEVDEFGFLRQVKYQTERPQIVLSDTSAEPWFLTKSNHWAYEKEWRMARVLREAKNYVGAPPRQVFLFDFPPESVTEIVLGLHSAPEVVAEIRVLSSRFPRVTLFQVHERPEGYELIVRPLS